MEGRLRNTNLLNEQKMKQLHKEIVFNGILRTWEETLSPTTLRNPLGCSPSLSLGSLNIAYLLCAFGTLPKFLATLGTSDTLGTLYAIGLQKKDG